VCQTAPHINTAWSVRTSIMYKYVSLTMQYNTSLLSSLLPPSPILKTLPSVSVRQYGSIIRIDLPAQQEKHGVSPWACLVLSVLTGLVFWVFVLVNKVEFDSRSFLTSLQNRYTPIIYQTWLFFGLRLPYFQYSAIHNSTARSRISPTIYPPSEPVFWQIYMNLTVPDV